MSTLRHRRGQATMELALLLPILFGLLYLVIYAFRLNHMNSDYSIDTHARALKQFNHGNSDAVVVDGVEVVPPPGVDLLPGDDFSWGDGIKSVLPDMAKQLGLNFLKMKIPNHDYVSGALIGATLSSLDSYASTGSFDTKTALWGAASGSLSSDKARYDFEGRSAPGQEVWGSGLRDGLVAGTSSQGDYRQFLQGSSSGVLNSNAAQNWLKFGGNDLLQGVTKGAITSSVAGLSSGNFSFKQVAISSGMGAVSSRWMADKVTGDGFSSTHDPRASATFGAMNATVGALLGGARNSTDLALAAANGAFFSGQSMEAVAGKEGKFDKFQVIGTGVLYGAATTLATGGDTSAIGRGALAAIVSSTQGYAMSKASKAVVVVTDQVTNGAAGATVEQARKKYTQVTDSDVAKIASEQIQTFGAATQALGGWR